MLQNSTKNFYNTSMTYNMTYVRQVRNSTRKKTLTQIASSLVVFSMDPCLGGDGKVKFPILERSKSLFVCLQSSWLLWKRYLHNLVLQKQFIGLLLSDWKGISCINQVPIGLFFVAKHLLLPLNYL